MKKTLYIGAKCVPSFYIGSGGSSEWTSGVPFEPLTVVTYNDTWFISKKPVPADADAPETGEYWAQVPGYVTEVTPEELQAILDDIEDLQEAVGDLDDLDTTAKTNLVSAVNEVKGETTELRDDLEGEIQDSIEWAIGSISTSTGYEGLLNFAYTNRLVTTDFLDINSVSVSGAGKLSPNIYNASLTLLGNMGGWVSTCTAAQIKALYPTAHKMRVIFKRDDNSDCSLTDISAYGVKVYGSKITSNDEEILDFFGWKIIDSFEQGSLSTEGLNQDNPDWRSIRARTTGYIKCKSGIAYNISVEGATSALVSASFYTVNDFSTYRSGFTDYATSISFTPSADGYFRLLLKASDSGNISATGITAIIEMVKSKDSSLFTNYVVGTDLLKRKVEPTYLGTLTYLQAFCRYNNKYYSINGTNISVQNSAFTETNSATLDTGHGNGLQLGNSKYAYVSGWNDNKIYKVDLDNLVVADIITLPTTGYTTGVVDEGTNTAYIFQRDSYPDHEDNYNFIVYDLTNQQIVSTKKILPYGAMQAADFFGGRIIVLNGLGNSACPNGYRVFDTSGNILAEYFFGDFSTIEPEGVCIDRDTHELYISFVDRKCYKIDL